MGRVFIDGFESGSLDLWDAVSGATVSSGISGADGTYCLNCASAYANASKTLPAASEYYLAFILRINSVNDAAIMRFFNGATLLGYIQFSSAKLQVFRGPNTALATGTTVFNSYTAHLIEIHYKPDASSGVFQVKVDGILEIDFSGQTAPSTLQINSIFFGTDGENWSHYFDNIIVDDAAWIGNTRIQAIQVNGPGAFSQFTPSAGANWQNVDEIPYSETDYNETGVSAKVDTFAYAALSGSPASVKCVQVQARAKLIGNPTPTNLQLVVNSGGTAYFSGSKALASVSKGVCSLWATDPATGQPWTVAGVNAAEIGYKSV